jgi:hypothetical protein
MFGNTNNNENQIPRIVRNAEQTVKDKDCLVKGTILRGLLNKSPMKSRELFDSIPYENYNSFRVLISRYCSSKYRYIERIGDKIKLTDTGRIHAHNPFYFREKYRNRQAKDRDMFLFEILNSPEKLNHYFGNMGGVQVKTVLDTVRQYVDSNSSLRDIGDGSDNHQSAIDDEIDYEDKYFSLKDEVKKLKTENFNMQIRMNQRPAQVPKVPDNKLPSKSMNKRYNLLCSWEKNILTSTFFEHELIPYDVLVRTVSKDAIATWKKKLNIDSDEIIGIFARNISSTLIKESFYRNATAEEIKEAGFYLTKNRGIRILSKKYASINKVVLKQSEIPIDATSPKKAPRINIVADKNRK